MKKWIYKLENKFEKFAIPNLMMFIVIGMFTVFVADMLFPDFDIWGKCYLDIGAVLQGELWRLLTFIFCPPSASVLWILISLMFYYMIGSSLENEWGSFRFNLYYFIGWLGTIIAAVIAYLCGASGIASNSFLNLSLFFAFAILFPNHTVMVMFILPVKIKWLAILDAAYFIFMLIVGSWMVRATIVASLINLIIFFIGDVMRNIRNDISYRKTRRNFRQTRNKYRW